MEPCYLTLKKELEAELIAPLQQQLNTLQEQWRQLEHSHQVLQQQCQQTQQQSQEMQACVDQLDQQAATHNWATHCSKDNEQKQGLFPVRQLRSKSTAPLPCEPTSASVEEFLQCETGSIQHVEKQPDNAHGKQRYIIQFHTAEQAAAAYARFRDSSNAAQAVLVLKRTRLQNALVDLAIQLQHLAREDCGFAEVTVQSRGRAVLVRHGAAEPTPYPFLQHMLAGHPPRPGQPFHNLTAAKVGATLSKLLGHQQAALHPLPKEQPPHHQVATHKQQQQQQHEAQAPHQQQQQQHKPQPAHRNPTTRASAARTPNKYPSMSFATAQSTSPTKHRPAAAPTNAPILPKAVPGSTPLKRKAEVLNLFPKNIPPTESTSEQTIMDGQPATNMHPPDYEQVHLESQKQPTTTKGRGRGRAVKNMYVGYCGGYGVGGRPSKIIGGYYGGYNAKWGGYDAY